MTNYADKSLQISIHCPNWGRWGMTMIHALFTHNKTTGLMLVYCELGLLVQSIDSRELSDIYVRSVRQSDVKSVTSREILNSYSSSVNYPPVSGVVTSNMPSTKLPLNNSSVRDTKYQWVSARANTQVVSSDTIDPVRVAIKDLYNSDLVLSHGIKLKWIRNRMMT